MQNDQAAAPAEGDAVASYSGEAFVHSDTVTVRNEELDEIRTVVKIDGVVIDDQTGEILEYPDGWTGDLIEHLIRAGTFAKQQQKDWDRAHDLYRFAIGKMLEERNIEAFASDRSGRAALRRQVRKTATVERLKSMLQRNRLPEPLCRAILQHHAVTLDTGALERLAKFLDGKGTPAGKAQATAIREELIETKTSRFIIVDPPRETAPNIVRFSQPTHQESNSDV